MLASQDFRIIEKYHVLMNRILSRLKKTEIVLNAKAKVKSEDFAEKYYEQRGYVVYRSRVKKGYRIIGVKYYWKKFEPLLSKEDKKIVSNIYDVMGENKFKELAYLIKDKNGCPDLMLIKGNKISFVEVKTDNEEIKASTFEWFIKIGKKYPISILRIKKVK